MLSRISVGRSASCGGAGDKHRDSVRIASAVDSISILAAELDVIAPMFWYGPKRLESSIRLSKSE